MIMVIATVIFWINKFSCPFPPTNYWEIWLVSQVPELVALVVQNWEIWLVPQVTVLVALVVQKVDYAIH